MSLKNSIQILLWLIILVLGFIFFIYKQNFLKNSLNSGSDKTDTPVSVNDNKQDIVQPPGCKVAFSPEIYLSEINFNDDFKTLLKKYRQGWQDACSSKTTEHSLYPLWKEAEQVAEYFNKNDNPLYSSTNYSTEVFDKIYNYSDKTFPSFVPGFESGYSEGEWTSIYPSIKLFAQNLTLGNFEDNDFFTLYPDEFNVNFFPKWISQTWDYGGCTLYGSYDWVKTLKSLDKLSLKIKSSGYLTDIDLFRKYILGNFMPTIVQAEKITPENSSYVNRVCTCNKKEDVLADAEKVLTYTVNSSIYTNEIPVIRNTIDNIKNGTLRIFSEAERHCSGG